MSGIIAAYLLLFLLLPVSLLNVVQDESASVSVEMVAVLFQGFNNTHTAVSTETKRRIHHALSIVEKSRGTYLVVVGGNRPGKVYSGAQLMASYVRETGLIDSEKILVEDRSLDSATNLNNIGTIMDELHVTSVGLVSSPLHLLRIRTTNQELNANVHFFPYDAASCSPPLSKWEVWMTVHYNLAAYIFSLVLPGDWYRGFVQWIRLHTEF